MAGTLALVGGGEFETINEALDRRLLAAAGATEVTVLPTADAFEHPERLVERAVAHFAGLGATVRTVNVLRRSEALEPGSADLLTGTRFVYLAGDSQAHLRAVLKDTPLWSAIVAVLEAGGVVAAASGAAAAMCDPMLDSRGGGVTLGLGLVGPLTFVPRVETLTLEWLKRIRELAGSAAVVEAPSGSAIVRTDSGWERVGSVAVHGELP
jgi:cyanophycinase